MKDARDVPVSISSGTALAHYETALQLLQTYTGDPIAAIDLAIAAEPRFAMGHLFKALALFTTSEQRFLPMVREAVVLAGANEASLNPRERGLLAAAHQLVAGRWEAASRKLDEVLAAYPRDALAIQIAHLLDFFRGDALNLRNRISRVLPHWSTSVPGYSYILGMHAFGLEECNQYVEAEAAGRRALELQPKDGWAVHAVTHVMEMQGRVDEGIEWLTTREADWAPDSAFAPHNWWHLALFYLDRGDYAAVLDLFDRKLDGPQTDMVLVLIDASALLWRLRLEGVDVGDRFVRIAKIWEDKLDIERGFYAFNDVHAMVSFAATDRRELMSRLTMQMEEAARGTNSNAAMLRDVGVPLAHGLLALVDGKFGEAARAIESVRDTAHRFGGSHAQRDLLSLTMIDALTRNGEAERARHYIGERQMHKPTAWSDRLLAKTRSQPRSMREPLMA